MDISAEQRRRGFNAWLRTGRWSPSGAAGGREVKFNPWHDPGDGRFTFANTGRYYGRAAAQQSVSSGRTASKIEYVEDDRLPPITSHEEVAAWKARELAKHGHKPEYQQAIEEQYRRYLHILAGAPSTRAAPGGESDAPDSSASSQNARPREEGGFPGGGGSFGGGGASGTWETPAPQPPQSQRRPSSGGNRFNGGGGTFGGGGATGSADRLTSQTTAVPTSSDKRDLARAGNRSAVASGAITAKASAGRVGQPMAVEVAKKATAIVWVEERIGTKGAAKDYNDSAASARSNVATRRAEVPALERTMPDGTKRLVKFDGFDGEYLIERKWSIVTSPRGKSQALRQSQALSEHGLTAIWEVPNRSEMKIAVKMLEKLQIENIKVRVIEP
jgi:uncharacterized membrane protein YgcG